MRWIVAGLAVAAVVMTGCADAGSTTESAGTVANETAAQPAAEEADVTVADVVGQPLDEAVATLEQAGLYVEVELAEGPGAAGEVHAQFPAGGSSTPTGASVLVKASPETTAVPDVVGLQVAEALRELRLAGFAGTKEDVESDEHPPGTVIESVPAAGRELEPGETVRLRLATEPAPKTHTVEVRVELWADQLWAAGDTGGCYGQYDYSAWTANRTVVLLGPDGSQLSSAYTGQGEMDESTVSPDAVAYPPELVCAFELTFTDVPEVATYRILEQGGTDDWPSSSLADMEVTGWRQLVWVE